MVYEKKEIDFKKLDNSNCQILEKIQKDKYTINWNEDEIKNLLKKGGGEGIILIYNSIPIGYCLFRILMDEVEILSIEIETKFRNMGLGLILFNEIERSFEERKISKCFLEVNINNDLARNFYEKLGFI
ncbi:MAG: GNAT family N-acetyltransferase, partial [Pseudomonadota bacterium]|nr:GNAT family N-acetyltransferase [Pseudomonadota bacterium]